MAESSNGGSSSSEIPCENSQPTVEVNVKTLDSQVYSFRVPTNMLVYQFKEKIASSANIPAGQQRLIFRGRVLKDDHVLSAYHIEDGITLHLVERQPVQPQASTGTNSGGANANNADLGNDSSTGVPRGRGRQVSHSVVLGTFDLGEQGEAVVPDINRIIGAVLNSLGIGGQVPASLAGNVPSSTPVSNTSAPNQASQGGNTEGSGGRNHEGAQVHIGPSISMPFQSVRQSVQFPLSGASITLPTHQMPIPDSLHTLSEFISRMELALSVNGNHSSSSPASVGGVQGVDLPSNPRGFPTPEALTVVLRRASQLLSGHTASALSHLAGLLEEGGSSNDLGVRNQVQNESVQVGQAMQHLGALFLELGRTILTLHMGQSPAESLVNAGPAVYISPSGPNPIMVQPFPLQTRSLFGGSTPRQTNFATSGSPSAGDHPRNVNIHIHTAVGSRANSGDATRDGRPNGGRSGGAMPARTVVVTTAPRSQGVADIDLRNAIPTESSGTPVSIPVPPHTGTSASQVPSGSFSYPALVAEITSDLRQMRSELRDAIPLQGSGAPVSVTVQPSAGTLESQVPLESFSYPALVAEITSDLREMSSELRGLVSNIQEENQVQSGQSEGSLFQGMSSELGTTQNMNTVEGGRAADSLHDGLLERRIEQPDDHQPSHDKKTSTSLASTEVSSASSGQTSGETVVSEKPIDVIKDGLVGILSGESNKEAVVSEKPLDVIGDAPSFSQSSEPPEADKVVPLGLGLGGLQPARRTGRSRLQGQSAGNTRNCPSSSQNQESINNIGALFQNLVSRGSNANGVISRIMPPVAGPSTDNSPSRVPGSGGQLDLTNMMSQVMNSPALDGLLTGISGQIGMGSRDASRNDLPLGVHGSGGQLDVPNMMSQVLNSPGMNGLLTGLSEQTGIGSADGLRNIFEQFTQSPGIRNTINQFAQQLEGQDCDNISGVGNDEDGSAGGFDLTRMMQQMMPIVSQAFMGGLPQRGPSSGRESENPQQIELSRQIGDERPNNEASQMDLQDAALEIARHDPPGVIFRTVLENVARLNSDESRTRDLVEALGSDEDLANEFMEMLQRHIARRLQEDSTSTNLS